MFRSEAGHQHRAVRSGRRMTWRIVSGSAVVLAAVVGTLTPTLPSARPAGATEGSRDIVLPATRAVTVYITGRKPSAIYDYEFGLSAKTSGRSTDSVICARPCRFPSNGYAGLKKRLGAVRKGTHLVFYLKVYDTNGDYLWTRYSNGVYAQVSGGGVHNPPGKYSGPSWWVYWEDSDFSYDFRDFRFRVVASRDGMDTCVYGAIVGGDVQTVSLPSGYTTDIWIKNTEFYPLTATVGTAGLKKSKTHKLLVEPVVWHYAKWRSPLATQEPGRTIIAMQLGGDDNSASKYWVRSGACDKWPFSYDG
jgi:hypothetical protein